MASESFPCTNLHWILGEKEGGNNLRAFLFRIRALFSFQHTDWRNALEEYECLDIPQSGNALIQRDIVLISKVLKSTLHPPLAELFFDSVQFSGFSVCEHYKHVWSYPYFKSLFVVHYELLGSTHQALFWQQYRNCFIFWQEQFSLNSTKQEASWFDLLLPPSSWAWLC